MSRLKNVHPGEILEEEFLKPLGISPMAAQYMIGYLSVLPIILISMKAPCCFPHSPPKFRLISGE